MRIVTENQVFDPRDEPIAVSLEPLDRLNILAMNPSARIYCAYPDFMTEAQIEEFMKRADEY